MANQIIQVPADDVGKKIDTSELTVGANTAQRQRIVIADDAAAAGLAAVGNGAPAGTEYGLLVRHVGTATVSGTVTANIGTSGSLALDATLTGGSQKTKLVDTGGANEASVSVGGALKVDGSAVAQPVTDNAGSLTVDNPTLSVTGGGVEASALRVTIASDSTGVLSVDDNGASLTVDNAALSVTGGGAEASALRVTIASDSTGVLSVDDNGGSITVDGTVTANAGTGSFTVAQATAANLNAQVAGTAAHDVGVSGNPVLVGAVAETMGDTAPANRVSAEGDAVRIAACQDGAIYVLPYGPQVWSYHSDGSTALTDATVHAAPGSGLSLYVQTIVFSSGAATAINAFFEEGASKVLGPYYLEAIAGRGMAVTFNPPKKITANTALTVTTSAAIAHAIDVTGFTAPG